MQSVIILKIFLISNILSADDFKDHQKENSCDFQTEQNIIQNGWTSQTVITSVSLYSVKAVNGEVAWACGSAGRVFRTTNGGTTWNPATNPSGLDNYAIDALDINTAFIIANGTVDGRIYRTTNGGVSWNLVYSTNTFLNTIKMFDAKTGYAQGDPFGNPLKYLLIKTTDGGSTWLPASDLTPGNPMEFGWNNSMFWLDSLYGWFGSNNSRIYRTSDGGKNWLATSTPFSSTVSIWFKDNINGLASTGQGIAKTTNGGLSWTIIPSPVNFNSYISGTFDKVWVTNNIDIIHTTDFGLNWSTQYLGSNSENWTHISIVNIGTAIHGWAVSINGHIIKYLEVLSNVQSENPSPSEFRLSHNYPNPFNTTTNIEVDVPHSEFITLKIFDITGDEIETIFADRLSKGIHKLQWKAEGYASGIYLLQLQAGNYKEIKKILLLK